MSMNGKQALLVSGILLGLVGVLLAYSGNPKNMAICIACFKSRTCFEPLMMADRAMKQHVGETTKVLVTEAHAKTNVEKFAKSKGRNVTTREVAQEYEIVIE